MLPQVAPLHHSCPALSRGIVDTVDTVDTVDIVDTGNFTGNHVPPTREEPAIQRGGNNQITQHATDQNAQNTTKNSKTGISLNASATAAVAASFIQIQPSL